MNVSLHVVAFDAEGVPYEDPDAKLERREGDPKLDREHAWHDHRGDENGGKLNRLQDKTST